MSNIQTNILKKFMKSRVEYQQNFYFHSSYSLEQQLLHCISKGELKEAEKILAEINKNERPKLANDKTRSLKNSLICSCTLFTRAIILGGVEPEKAFSLSDVIIIQIEEINDIQELIRLEYDMLNTFIKTLRDEKKSSYRYVINKAISYIHQEILGDLSLDKIAEHVQVHPSYLSQIFKNEVKHSLTKYICKKRIEDSKYFLIHSTMSISDIAILFKFCNQSYYTSKFKEFTGLTPRKYRVLHSK